MGMIFVPWEWFGQDIGRVVISGNVFEMDNTTCNNFTLWYESDRIPSTTPGAEPPRDPKDSGSARSHSTHLETSSSNRP